MLPSSTDIGQRVLRHPLLRFGGPMLAVALAVPLAGLAISWGGSLGERNASVASAVEPSGEDVAPDRASRSAIRREEPALSRNTTTTAVQVEVTQETEEWVIPVPKELRDDPAMPKGQTRVEADGSPGRERVVFVVTSRNGRIVGRQQIASEIISPASPRVVYVGRGGGRGAPTGDDGFPLKLQLAEDDATTPPASDFQPVRRFATAEQAAWSGGGRQEGGASWYRSKPGTCAHRTIPKGTVVKVTNLATGQSIHCTVADRGPFVGRRIMDLDRSVFLSIAESPEQGVLQVRIEW